jgi:lysozyme family protein
MRSGFTAILPWIWRVVAAIGTAAAGAFSQLALSLAVLTETTFPALSAAFLSLGAVIEATPIGWLLTIVAALGFAGYELVEHWSAVSGFFKTMWNDIAGFFQAGVQKIEKIPAVRWALHKLGIAAPGAGGSAPSKSSPSGAGSTSTSASDRAINTVLQNEDRGLTGKVTNDSGGVTKFGISSKAHPGLDVSNLSLADAKRIYKTEYWDPIGGDSLPAALQATALDAAINQGVGNAKAWLKASGGDPIKFNALRRGQYEHLASSNPEKYGKYLKGWEARVPSATQSALATASAGSSTASLPRLGAGTSVLAANPSSSVTNNNSEVSMGNVIIQTRATDPKGIAASIKPLLKSSVLVAQSQSGVS